MLGRFQETLKPSNNESSVYSDRTGISDLKRRHQGPCNMRPLDLETQIFKPVRNNISTVSPLAVGKSRLPLRFFRKMIRKNVLVCNDQS